MIIDDPGSTPVANANRNKHIKICWKAN